MNKKISIHYNIMNLDTGETYSDISDSIIEKAKEIIKEFNLAGKSRKTEDVLRRQIMFYYMYKNTKLKLQKLGKLFGKDHATVLHNIRCFKENKKYNKNIFQDYIGCFEDEVVIKLNVKRYESKNKK